MKKLYLMLLSICTILSFTACSNKNNGPDKTIEQTRLSDANDKVPDPYAPDLVVVSIFHKDEGKDTLGKSLDDVPVLNETTIMIKLAEYGVIGDKVTADEFTVDGTSGTLKINTNGDKLDLSNNETLYSIVDTFIENFELDKLTIIVDGKNDPNLVNLEYRKKI